VWTVHWADNRQHWHLHSDASPTLDIADLIAEVQSLYRIYRQPSHILSCAGGHLEEAADYTRIGHQFTSLLQVFVHHIYFRIITPNPEATPPSATRNSNY